MQVPTISDIEKRLDKLYATDLRAYIEDVKTIKGLGYKVFKNGNGKHKVRLNEENRF